MTTTITLETHSWPTTVVTHDSFESACGTQKRWTHTEEVVPPDSKRVFHVHSTRSIEFIEMPLPPTEAVDNLG